MKLTPRKKKILAVLTVLVLAVVLTGCSIPKDSEGNIILIKSTTTFSDVMSDENWFSAIFVWPLAWIINNIAPVVGVGGAIALVTIVVNGLLAAVTLKSTIGQQQMQLVQPEMEKINRKYEGRDDETSKMRQANEMQALYKKYDINPVGTLLITFIQLPIIFAMYMAVERAEAVANGTFAGMDLQKTPWTAIQGLFKGDMGGIAYIVLFVVMVLCQLLSMFIPQILQKKKAEAEAAKHHRKPEKAGNSQKVMQIGSASCRERV